MNYWYSCRPTEIFLDLDSTRAIARALSVLRLAKLNKQLHVKSVWLYPTKQQHHAHMIIELKARIPALDRIAWTLWMGSDRLRASFALARIVRGCAHVELFCTSKRYYRMADSVCQCTEKHKAEEVTKHCPAMRALLGPERDGDYFARTGRRPTRRKIRVPWGRVNQKQILQWKEEKHGSRKGRI